METSQTHSSTGETSGPVRADDVTARALVECMQADASILDDLPDKGWASIKLSDLEHHIAEAIRAERRKVWEVVTTHFDHKFSATDQRIDNVRDHRVDEFYKWCREQIEGEKP